MTSSYLRSSGARVGAEALSKLSPPTAQRVWCQRAAVGAVFALRCTVVCARAHDRRHTLTRTVVHLRSSGEQTRNAVPVRINVRVGLRADCAVRDRHLHRQSKREKSASAQWFRGTDHRHRTPTRSENLVRL